MSDHTMQRLTLDELRTRFHGSLHTQDDPGYDEARIIFNAAVESRPRLIAECTDVDDVRTVLHYARGNGLDIAVRGGGHSVAGASLVDDGVVIDLRGLNDVSVAPEARTVTVGGGTIWGEMDRATAEHGLVTTGGRVSTTGVAGLTLGGGSGWVERAYGLACDNLLEVELMTADGSMLRASESENRALFWALHGGGGNFGIATSLTFQLHPLDRFSIALLVWPKEQGREVIAEYRDFVESAPDAVGGGALYCTGVPDESFPERLAGKLCCLTLVTYLGSEPQLRALLGGLLRHRPAGELITEIPYVDLQCMLDDPPGYRNYWSADHLGALPDEAIDRFCATAELMVVPSPSQHALLPWGGAVARNAESGTVINRDAPWVVHPLGLWEDPADDQRARDWAKATADELRPWMTGDVYLNFIGDEGADRIVAGFGRTNYERLARIKAAYDPDNVFNRWHNVLPAGRRSGVGA